MQNIDSWDQEILALAGDVTELEREFCSEKYRERLVLFQKKAQLFEMQNQLEQWGARFRRLKDSALNLPPKAMAMLHWTEAIHTRVSGLYQKRSRLLGRRMWVQLIKARLTGGTPHANFSLQDKDLLEMASRRASLVKTESYLNDQLVAAEYTKKELTKKYQKLMALAANAEAAASLQSPLGRSFKESVESPGYRALESYFRWLTLPLRNTTFEEKQFQKIDQNFRTISQNLLELCRGLVLGERQTTRLVIGDNAMKKLKNDLNMIHELQQQLEFTSQQVISKTPPPAKPILVKKNISQVKRNGT